MFYYTQLFHLHQLKKHQKSQNASIKSTVLIFHLFTEGNLSVCFEILLWIFKDNELLSSDNSAFDRGKKKTDKIQSRNKSYINVKKNEIVQFSEGGTNLKGQSVSILPWKRDCSCSSLSWSPTLMYDWYSKYTGVSLAARWTRNSTDTEQKLVPALRSLRATPQHKCYTMSYNMAVIPSL